MIVEGGREGVVAGDEGADVRGGEGGEHVGFVGGCVGEGGGVAEMGSLYGAVSGGFWRIEDCTGRDWIFRSSHHFPSITLVLEIEKSLKEGEDEIQIAKR